MYAIDPILKNDLHPFYIGPISPESKLNTPTSIPFYLGIHPKYAIPVLILTDEIQIALSNAYSFGSMLSTPLGDSSLSNIRMFEILEKLLSVFNGNLENTKFLEIGCGTGALLNELKIRGAEVMGVEIGPQGQEGAEKYGFPVIDELFMPGVIDEKFDCILSSGCLEHIVDLETFFSASRGCLKDNGLFFHSVPNSEFNFNSGNLDHLCHEHVNYFTPKNGTRLFSSQGFKSASACPTNAGNELFIWGYFDKNANLKWPGGNVQFIIDESEELSEYSQKLESNTNRIVSALKTMQSDNESIGLYAGGFEYSILLKDSNNIRYFDGDESKHGKIWLQGLPLIESPHSLKTEPVDNLIICKSHYFDAIVNYLFNEINIPSNIKVYNIENLISKEF